MNTTYTFADDAAYVAYFDGRPVGQLSGANARLLYARSLRPERYEFVRVGDDVDPFDFATDVAVVEDPVDGTPLHRPAAPTAYADLVRPARRGDVAPAALVVWLVTVITLVAAVVAFLTR